MTGAELKTLLESLGLSVQWACEHIAGGVSKRTFEYWLSGRDGSTPAVPEDVAANVLELERMAVRAASESVGQAQLTRAKRGAPEVVELYRYRTDAEMWEAHPEMRTLPATYHAAMLARSRALLLEQGFTVEIQWRDRRSEIAFPRTD